MHSKNIKKIVIFATSYLPLIGGAQVAVDETCKRITGYDFVLFCPRLKKECRATEKINNVQVFRIGFGYNIDKYLFPFVAPVFVLRKFGNKCLIWAIMANYGGLGALFYHLLTLKRNTFFLSLHEGATFEYIKLRSGYFYFLIKRIIKNVDYLHLVSSYSLCLARKMGFFSNRYRIIPDGVDLERFSLKRKDQNICMSLFQKYNINKSDKILFTASRITKKNALSDVVEALRFLPKEYKFVIAGSGELESEILNKIKKYNLEKSVILLGDCTQDEIVQFLAMSRIFIRPSIRESFGMVFIESMAMGVPIIATLEGGIKDFLIDRETGIVVGVHDVESIIKAVRDYEDADLYAKIQENGLKLVKERFDWNLISVQVKEIFDHFIDKY